MRVTMAKSEQLEQEMKGLRKFTWEPGRTYKIIFPVDENGHEILYAVPQHQINLGKIRGKSRCVKDYFQYEDDNETLKLDPVTGEPLNDGTCPYCELGMISRKKINADMDAWREANPDATEKEEKEKFKELIKPIPVGIPELGRGFIVAVVQTKDVMGMEPVLVGEGDNKRPAFEIQFLPMTTNQYETKFKKALMQYGGVVNNTELVFSYPEGDKMTSAKDMTINPSINPVLNTYPALKDDIAEAISKMDLDEVENLVFNFKPETVVAIRRKIASVREQWWSELSDEQKEELADRIEDSLVTADTATIDDVISSFGASNDDEAEEVDDDVAITL